ncbi:MAG: hypothetical protein IKC31_04015 [Clostridia bacterium]|nr:hypothetical protein [Clostridia bacterium]
MDILKKVFPISYRWSESIGELIIGILMYVVLSAIVGGLVAVAGFIPIIGLIISFVVGPLVGIYCLAGIVIELLVFLNVLN